MICEGSSLHKPFPKSRQTSTEFRLEPWINDESVEAVSESGHTIQARGLNITRVDE
jgi:hypothetical protein